MAVQPLAARPLAGRLMVARPLAVALLVVFSLGLLRGELAMACPPERDCALVCCAPANDRALAVGAPECCALVQPAGELSAEALPVVSWTPTLDTHAGPALAAAQAPAPDSHQRDVAPSGYLKVPPRTRPLYLQTSAFHI